MGDLAIWQSAIKRSEKLFNDRNLLRLVDFNQEASFASQAIKKNEYLMKIAQSRPDTLTDAIVNIASIGLSLNPARKHAYLVPRDGVCCLDVSYIGLIKIATDAGGIEWAKADLVYENDDFIYKGPYEKPDLISDPFNKDKGEFKGVYCVAKTSGGDYLVEVMSAEEIYKVREKSMAYSKSGRGPWIDFFGEMAKKTVIKRASKTWPIAKDDNRLQDAIQILNEHEGIKFDGLKICGVEISEFVDIDKIDKDKIKTLYDEAKQLVDDWLNGHDLDSGGPERAREIDLQLNDEERIVFDKLMSLEKTGVGNKKYKSTFYDYTNIFDQNEVLIDG